MSITEQNTSNRRLAAILFADIVGYTAMMQTDEKKANTLLGKFLNTINTQIEKHNGQVINNYGDGCVCIFESAVSAIHCAKEIQSTFQSELIVPVRIGLHSGDVFFKEDNVFGDSVNIASRIESMGVPGAVLVSKRVRDVVKNQADLLLPSLGTFEFKNVEEPIEVFALANEGFVVPQKGDMKGKFKEKSKPSFSKMLIPALLVGIIAMALWMWQSNSNSGGFNLPDTESIEPANTPLSKDIRNKRVAIMVFDNKTGSDDLEDFGVMISDWITKGLMETGDANVISAANIQNKVALASMDGSNSKRFAQETGVGVLVQGRYYMQENQLIIHANLVDAELGEVIHALKPIQGPRNKMLGLLDELTDEVLGYWSVKSKSRFLKNPPKYEAYQKYLAANIVWSEKEHLDEIEQLLTEAISLDSEFHEARLKLAVHYGNSERDLAKSDSLIALMEQSDSRLSKWEQLRLQQIKAGVNMEWQKGAGISEKMYAMDASDAGSNYNASNFFVRANMPEKAIHVLTQMEDKYRDFDTDQISRMEWRLSESYYMLGNYANAIEAAQDYPFSKMITHHARLHLRSLIRLDSLHLITDVLDQYADRGIYTEEGVKREKDELIISVCSEAYLLDNEELLKEYVDQLKEWNGENKELENYSFNNGVVAFFGNDIASAISHFEKEELNPKRGWDYMNSLSIRGLCYGILGDKDEALAYIDKINAFEADNLSRAVPNKLFSGQSDYMKARIYAALGQSEEAITNLEIAKNKRFWFYPYVWQYDVFLKPLFDKADFQELVKPKG